MSYRARRRLTRTARLALRPSPPRPLAPVESQSAIAVLHDGRFLDLAPAQVYATLLYEGVYLCCERSMYRLLAAQREVREQRRQIRHPTYTARE